jgi:hypothetical protein
MPFSGRISSRFSAAVRPRGEAIGLKVPESFLLRADEVIE